VILLVGLHLVESVPYLQRNLKKKIFSFFNFLDAGRRPMSRTVAENTVFRLILLLSRCRSCEAFNRIGRTYSYVQRGRELKHDLTVHRRARLSSKNVKRYYVPYVGTIPEILASFEFEGQNDFLHELQRHKTPLTIALSLKRGLISNPKHE
jgi:hypothetical protein